jgi:xylan 1,4-beta-xylosidase
MNKLLLVLILLLVITSLVFSGCTGANVTTTTPQTTTLPTTTTSPPTTTQTQTPTTTPPETVNWLDVTQYTGIPSSDCGNPVVDLTDLPAAQFKLTADMTKQEGTLDNNFWANVGLSYCNCGTTDDNVRLWELNRQTGVLKYVRIFGPFTDGIYKWLVDVVNQFLTGQRSLVLGTTNFFYEGWRLYSEDENDFPQYNFWHMDCVLDSFISAGIKPIVGIDLMPDALAEGEKVRGWDGGLVNTPSDYDKWRDLIYQTIRHCIERYGVEEVRTWYWEIWNEPDVEAFFIDATSGNTERFLKMYDYFVAGAKAADSQIKVGGPSLAFNDDWLRAFLSHCVNGTNYATGETGAPLDFICWHGYGDVNTLMAFNRAKMAIVNQYPSLKDVPILQDEYGQTLLKVDENGKVIEDLQWSEENYTHYAAAFQCKYIDALLADPKNQPDLIARAGLPTSSTSTFRYFSISTGGYFIPMPILNTYLLLAKLGSERIELTGTSYGDAIHGLATKTSDGVQVLLYNCDESDNKNTGAAKEVDLIIKGLPSTWTTMKQYRIDGVNSNAWTDYSCEINWYLIPQSQLVIMENNSKLKIVEQTDSLQLQDGEVTFRLTMPANSVSLIVIGNEAAPPAFAPSSPHISRVIQEESAYKAACNMQIMGYIASAKAAFEQLVADSFGAVADGSSNDPYSLWGQKALFALLNIAKSESDNAVADDIRVQLLSTTLGDIDRYILLDERLSYLQTTGNESEAQSVAEELQAVRLRLEYFTNWSNWQKFYTE